MEKNEENEIYIDKSSSSSSDEEDKKEKDKEKNIIENQEEKIEKDNDKNKIINEEEKNEKDIEKNEIINEDEKKSVLDKMKDFFKVSSTKEDNPLKKDENREIEEIISSKGFRVQKHFIKTEDGYTLIAFRIPGLKGRLDSSSKPPVLFQHGIFDSSDGWVCNGEEHSIPFIFAKNNFDVWISNSRGNKYCKEHEKYDNKSFEFWQFSFHEMGLYDIPAVINYINSVNKSGEKIIYFGHSQGTSLMFSGLTQKFDFYKKNIKLFVALAPVVRLTHIGKTLNFLSKISIHKLIKKIKIYEMAPNTKTTNKIMNFMDNYASLLVTSFIDLIADTNCKECNDRNAMSVYLKHYPCGCSLKCLIHFIHIIKSKKFIYYDYKDEANFALYNQAEPPEYDLNVIKDFPIMLIGGELDKLGTPEDIKWLNSELEKNNNVIYYKILPNMGHLSFMVAKDFSWFDEPFQIIMNKFNIKK